MLLTWHTAFYPKYPERTILNNEELEHMRVKLQFRKQFKGTFCPKITVFYYISHANKIMREFSAEKYHWSNSDPKIE